jgi:hypothetical protein
MGGGCSASVVPPARWVERRAEFVGMPDWDWALPNDSGRAPAGRRRHALDRGPLRDMRSALHGRCLWRCWLSESRKCGHPGEDDAGTAATSRSADAAMGGDDEAMITRSRGRRAAQRSAGGVCPGLARVDTLALVGRPKGRRIRIEADPSPQPGSTPRVRRQRGSPCTIGELAPAQSGRPVSGSGDGRG